MCRDEKIDNKDPWRQKVLLVEYQAAQSSAQHHDQLLWTVTSIMWGSSLVLMGFILKSPMTTLLGVIVSITLCVLGIILTIFVRSAQRQFRCLRNTKYARCKVIEEELGMEQHLKIKWPAGSQTWKYSIIMVLFLVTWVLVAMSAFWNFLTSIR
jgi:hypothetical protein